MTEEFINIPDEIVIDKLSKVQWRTKEGKLIFIRDMNDNHLRNTALMLMGMGYQTFKAPDEIKIKWLTVLRLEWERRMCRMQENHD